MDYISCIIETSLPIFKSCSLARLGAPRGQGLRGFHIRAPDSVNVYERGKRVRETKDRGYTEKQHKIDRGSDRQKQRRDTAKRRQRHRRKQIVQK